MHELCPHITRTRICFGQKFQRLKTLGFWLKSRQSAGDFEIDDISRIQDDAQNNSTTSWVIFLNRSSYGRLYVGLVGFDKSRVP